MKLTRWIAAGLMALLAGPAFGSATSKGPTIDVVNVAALTAAGHDFSLFPSIHLEGFYAPGDGGGGDFGPCTSCTVDGGVVFADGAGNKYLRQFNGAVHLPWYGVLDGTTTACTNNYASCDATSVIAPAFAAAALYGNGVVSCGGSAVVINSGNLYIPPNEAIDCDLPPGGRFNQNNSSAYWNLPNSIILNPAYTIYGDTRTARTNLIVRPTWYGTVRPSGYTSGINAIPTTVHDVVMQRRLFTGTSVTGAGEASNLSNIFDIGFDTCTDQSASADSTSNFVISDCNLDVFLWGQRGGYTLSNYKAKPIIAVGAKQMGVGIDLVRWPITAAADDGSGQIKLTVNNTYNAGTICPTDITPCLAAGYTVLVNGLAMFNNRVNTTGIVHNGSDSTDCGPLLFCITNVPNTTNNGQDGIDSIQIGSTISDQGSAGCSFSGLTVVNKDTSGLTVWLSGAPSGCSPNPTLKEPLLFISNSGGPAGANARWLAGAVSGGSSTIVLQGSSYTGPTYTGVKWTAGSNVLKVYDTTNVYDNQFVCSSGTAPFCTPPTAFSASATTTSSINTLGASSTGIITVASTANWPYQGYLKTPADCTGASEWMGYSLIANTTGVGYQTTKVQVMARGVDATATCSHSNGISLTPSAPMVIQAVPEPESTATSLVLASVIISSTAQTTEASGQTVEFLNDNTVTSGLSGELVLNANYQTWTGNLHAGSGPFGPMVTTGTTNGSTSLTSVANTAKIQPGMSVIAADIPAATPVTTTATWAAFTNTMVVTSATGINEGMSITATGIPNGTLVVGVNGTTVTFSKRATLAGAPASITFSGTVVTAVSGYPSGTVTINATASGSSTEKISFGGCGYPYSGSTPQPWLGNCRAATFQFGSLTDPSNQGSKFVNLQSFGKPAAMSLYNSPDTTGTNIDFANGSGVGAQIDPASTGLDIEGTSNDSIHITNGSINGSRIGTFMNLTTVNNDSIGINDISLGINSGLVFGITGAGGTVNLHSLGGHSPNASYFGPSTAVLNLVNNQLSATTVFSDNPAATTPLVNCSANSFALVPASCAGTLANSTFTPTGASTATSLPNFADRALSMLDFGGVPSNTATPTDATVAWTAAQAAAASLNIHLIRFDPTASGSRYYIPTMTIPAYTTVWCPSGGLASAQTGARGGLVGTGDYTTYPNTIVTNGITTAGPGAQIVGCNVIKQGINVNGGAPANVQDLYNNAAAESGIGFNCLDDCFLDNFAIIGFDTGIKINGVRNATLKNLSIDSRTGLNISFQRGGGKFIADNLDITSWLTHLTTFSVIQLPLSSFADDGSGHIRYTLASSCSTGNCPVNGYTICVVNPPNAQSAQGCWAVSSVTATTGVFLGTTSGLLAGGAGVGYTATIELNSPRVSGLANTTQLQPGQSITGTCIPANATVAAVWPQGNIVEIDSQHLPTCTATETVTFIDTTTDQTCSLAPIAVAAGGSGYLGGDVLVVSGGTGTACQIIVDTVDGSGAVLTAHIDPLNVGDYTVFPTNPVSTTGGTGSSATFNISPGGTIALYPSKRTGPGIQIGGFIANVLFGNTVLQDHNIGIKTVVKMNNVTFTGCQLDDNNAVQDFNDVGVQLNGATQSFQMTNCTDNYFADGIEDNTSAGSNLGPNIFTNIKPGGPDSTSGKRRTMFSVDPNGGSPKHSSLVLTNISAVSNSAAWVSDDTRSVQINGNDLLSTVLYCEKPGTAKKVSGTSQFVNGGGTSASALFNVSCPVFPSLVPDGLSSSYTPTAATVQLMNSDCGKLLTVGSVGSDITYLLPPTPYKGCRLTSIPSSSFNIFLDPNGNDFATRNGSVTTLLKIPAANGSPTVSVSWNQSHWYPDGGSPNAQVASDLSNGQIRKHGDVYLSFDSGNSRLQLCPYNGNGGLVVSTQLEQIPTTCSFIPDTATTGASRINYIYAFKGNTAITGAADNGGGLVRLTLTSINSLQNGDTVCVRNLVTGTTEANGCWIAASVGASGNSVDLVGSTFTNAYTSGGVATYLALNASATGHATVNGIEVNSGNSALTLVGMAYLNGSQHFTDSLVARDVISWFNPQPKKMLVALGANAATTTSTTFKTPTTTAVEGEFVTFGPPGTPGTVPVPAVPWSITTGAAGSSLASVAQIGACFGTSSLGTNAACGGSVETEIASQTQAVATDGELYSVTGETTTLTEGRNFMDLVANVSAGTLTLTQSGSFLSAYLQQ